MRILLIEDDRATGLALRHRLEERKHEVDWHRDISEVQETGEIDVCLLDLGLVRTAGAETVLRFKRSFPLIPVVVLTSNDDPRIAATITPQVVVKNFGDQLLMDKIDAAIDDAVRPRTGDSWEDSQQIERAADEICRRADKLEPGE